MQLKWIKIDKSSGAILILKNVDNVKDVTFDYLHKIKDGMWQDISAPDLETLKKRKLVIPIKYKTYKISKGPQFKVTWSKGLADFTLETLANNSWKGQKFKEYNFNTLGIPTGAGQLHPLLKVRTQFREIFLEMGFEEMPTNNFVESSFWNFDALFQPQQHPARDMHDTFFISKPESTLHIDPDYLKKVKMMHEVGGYGSIGYRYDWKEEEARKNILRTHTTCVSARMLYALAQGEFKAKKYFSIDRVFRNEALDATHSAEFHQMEGLVADFNLTLGDLIGVIETFFKKLGISKLKFKPAYNPYTEPSMEIFSYHEGLKRWVEIGNSGIFRPEMLLPMGLHPDVRVIAWGLSLERPTMILYGIKDIRDLLGHKVDLKMVRENPICRLDKKN